MKILKKYFVLLFFLPCIIDASGGSVYTRYGIGDIYMSYSARRLAMGGLGVAVPDVDYLGTVNPAAWYKLDMTRFETGINFQGSKIAQNSQSAFYSQTDFSGFTIGFPVSTKYGISLVGGLVPYSKVNYEVTATKTDPIVNDYQLDYKGTGGVSKIFLGTSYKLPFDFVLGATFDYYTGEIERTTAVTFDAAVDYRNATYINRYSYRGVGFNFGFLSNDFSEMLGLGSISELRLGVDYGVVANMTVDTAWIANSPNYSSTVATGTVGSKLPYKLNLGISMLYDKHLRIAADYYYQPWGQYDFGSSAAANLTGLSKYSAGVEYRNDVTRATSFWEQIILRGGLSYETSQYIFGDENIKQYSIYAGFSLPLGIRNSLDFAFQYGKRGSTDNGLLTENIYNFSVSLSLGQLWFIREER